MQAILRITKKSNWKINTAQFKNGRSKRVNILYMTNMYHPLFFMTSYDLGLDKFLNDQSKFCFHNLICIDKKPAGFFGFSLT